MGARIATLPVAAVGGDMTERRDPEADRVPAEMVERADGSEGRELRPLDIMASLMDELEEMEDDLNDLADRLEQAEVENAALRERLGEARASLGPSSYGYGNGVYNICLGYHEEADEYEWIEVVPKREADTLRERLEGTEGPERYRAVLVEVVSERDRQLTKWGEQQHHPGVWSLILAEELGEVAERALHDDAAGIRRELVQAAAVLVAWIEALDAARAAAPDKERDDG
jgi:hypothetical protein